MRKLALCMLLLFFTGKLFTQCASGVAVFRESFGGSFSSVEIGPAFTNATTSYSYNGSGTLQQGEYSLRKHTGGMNNWLEGSDNTGQGGYMMMVRTNPSLTNFYQASVKGFCRAQSQGICFSAAALGRKGIGRDVSIQVQVRNASDNSLLANFTSTPLKSGDSITWSSFFFFLLSPERR